MTEERTGRLEAPGGGRLFFRTRLAKDSRGRLLAVHGHGEHSGRFGRVAECAATARLDFHAFDLRGHGRSGGRRGHAGSFDLLLSDLDSFRRHVGDGESRLPTFLLGHSLGGLIVGRYVQEFGFPALGGVVLVAPFVDLALRPPTWKLRFADLADRVFPGLTMDNGIRGEMLLRTREERQAREDDPLVHSRMSARLWGEMRRNAGVFARRAEQSRTHFLLQLAGADRVVSTPSALELSTRLGGNARAVVYDDAYHDVYHDPAGGEAAADLLQWLGERLEGGGGAGAGTAV